MPSQIVTTFGSYATAPTQIVRLMFGSSAARRIAQALQFSVLQSRARSSEQRHSQHSASDEFTQNVARRRHDGAGMGVTKQPFDAVCFENAAPPQTRIAAEVTAMATSPAAALVSSTRNMVVSRGCSR